MSLETASFIKALVSTNPEGTDPKSQGDDHLRMIKAVLLSQFAGFTDGIPITKTESQINAMLTAGAGGFGLGGTAIAFNDPNLIPDKTGFYVYSGGGANLPPGALGGDSLIHIFTSAASKTQLWQYLNGAVLTRSFQTSTWTAWQPHVIGVKQTGPLDATAGAVLLTGAFGLGITGAVSAAQNIDVPNNVNYILGRVAGTTGTFPTGGTTGDMIISLAFAATAQMQMYWCPSTQTIWNRFILSGAVTPWDCMTQLGVKQSWANLTASRAFNTSYTNATARPIYVSVTGTGNANANVYIEAVVGAIIVGRQQISDFNAAGTIPGVRGNVSFVVPPGSTYNVNASATANIDMWSELR